MSLLLSLCKLLLLASTVDACLPTGLGGIFGGGSGACGGRPGGCAVATAQYSAPMPPPIYSFTPQMYQPPPPPPPPPALAPTRELPPVSSSAAIAAASSYQGMYQDRPQAPSINPEYQGTAPLSFASSEDAANTIIDPLKYIEHVSVSHTPASPATTAPESYPPSPPADPFVQKQQIQVAPSSASSEDTYLPGPPESGEKNSTLTTYYNQLCAGDSIATGEKETMNSASKKCELLKCVAANAQPDSHGTFTVTYLKSATSRTNSKGNYCLSTVELPAKSKRVIRRFDEMTSTEVRRKIFKL